MPDLSPGYIHTLMFALTLCVVSLVAQGGSAPLGAPDTFTLFHPQLSLSQNMYTISYSGGSSTEPPSSKLDSSPSWNWRQQEGGSYLVSRPVGGGASASELPIRDDETDNDQESEVSLLTVGSEPAEIAAGHKRSESTQSTVPVITLDSTQEEDEKVLLPEYLDMFPQDLLDSDTKVKPIDIKIIEHDDFIDYEIEFVELKDEEEESRKKITEELLEKSINLDYSSGNRNIFPRKVDNPPPYLNNHEVTTERLPTTLADLGLSTTAITAVTFMDLLQRARQRHRTRVRSGSAQLLSQLSRSTSNNNNNNQQDDDRTIRRTTMSPLIDMTTTPMEPEDQTNSWTVRPDYSSYTRRRSKIRGRPKIKDDKTYRPRKRIPFRSAPKTRLISNIYSGGTTNHKNQHFKSYKLSQRFTKLGRSTTIKPIIVSKPTQQLHTPIHNSVEDEDLEDQKSVLDLSRIRGHRLDNQRLDSDGDWSASNGRLDNQRLDSDGGWFLATTTTTTMMEYDIQTTTEPEEPAITSTKPAPTLTTTTTTTTTMTTSTSTTTTSTSTTTTTTSTTTTTTSTTTTTTTTSTTTLTTTLSLIEGIKKQLEELKKTTYDQEEEQGRLTLTSTAASSTIQSANPEDSTVKSSESNSDSDDSASEMVTASAIPLTVGRTPNIYNMDDLQLSESRAMFNVPADDVVSARGHIIYTTTPRPDGLTTTVDISGLARTPRQSQFDLKSLVLSPSSSDLSSDNGDSLLSVAAPRGPSIPLLGSSIPDPGNKRVEDDNGGAAPSIYRYQINLEHPTTVETINNNFETTTTASRGVQEPAPTLAPFMRLRTTTRGATLIPETAVTSERLIATTTSTTTSTTTTSTTTTTTARRLSSSSGSLWQFDEADNWDTTHSPERQPRIIENNNKNKNIAVSKDFKDYHSYVVDQDSADYSLDDDYNNEGGPKNDYDGASPYEASTLVNTYDGQYTEINPGQYHEVNPGQYHEVNPGQYHESNPGQYHEVNPGQYTETNPGQPVSVGPVTVDFKHKDQTKIYNVEAKAGDFIVGEVGKINVDSGQTLEGVRYTAVDGFLDKGQISAILQKFFGTG